MTGIFLYLQDLLSSLDLRPRHERKHHIQVSDSILPNEARIFYFYVPIPNHKWSAFSPPAQQLPKQNSVQS